MRLRVWMGCGLLAGCLSKPELEKPPEFEGVTLGARHACALDDGKIYCWGDARYGQVGSSMSLDPVATPARVGTDSDWFRISAGAVHTCGLRGVGDVYCWGNNNFGQVKGAGDGLFRTLETVAFSVVPPPTLRDISAGGRHTCAIAADGTLWCWGYSDDIGQDAATAIQIGTRTDWRAVESGTNHTLAIAGDEVFCFGDNFGSQCGRGLPELVPEPVAVPLPAGLVPIKLAAGELISCAILGERDAKAGQLYCWGLNRNVVIADHDNGMELPPTRDDANADWTDISLEGDRACGVHGGEVYCWGFLPEGTRGDGMWGGSAGGPSKAFHVGKGDDVEVGISAANESSTEFACMISGGVLQCWGDSPFGELGTGSVTVQPQPIEIAALDGKPWQHLWVGYEHTCASNANGLYCWGYNAQGSVDGSVGRGDDLQCVPTEPCDYPSPHAAPVAIDTAQSFDVVAGDQYSCTRQGTTVKCWGDDAGGRLGVQMPLGHTPQTVAGSYTKIFGGPHGTCGVSASGTVSCWGRIGGNEQRTPMAFTMAPLSMLSELSLSNEFSCGRIGTDRICWGRNAEGQIATGAESANEPPVRITDTLLHIGAGAAHACAIRGDNSVWCWGDNGWGQAAQDVGSHILSPAAVQTSTGTLQQCQALSVGEQASCALCNGIPYCWGRNDFVQLGSDRDSYQRRYADQVTGLTNVTELGIGMQHGCALSASGLWCWGGNLHGQLGNGQSGTNLPVPVAARN